MVLVFIGVAMIISFFGQLGEELCDDVAPDVLPQVKMHRPRARSSVRDRAVPALLG